MRNKEQEMAWRKVIEACMEDVKHHFDDIQQAIEFGCYIQPDNYFVSYIFATDSQLETARQSGLTEQINSYHREQLIKSHTATPGGWGYGRALFPYLSRRMMKRSWSVW